MSWWQIAAIAGGALGLAMVFFPPRFGGGPGPGRLPRGPEVPRTQNRWPSVLVYAQALAEAYRSAGVPESSVLLAVTHSMMATGAWGPSGPTVFCFNVGVIRAGPSWPGAWCRAGTVEVVDHRDTEDPADDVRVRQPAQAWRAYGSLADSCRDTLALWQGSRYRDAWDLLVAGDPSWSRRLGELGWYTAEPRFFERIYRNRLERVRRLTEGVV